MKSRVGSQTLIAKLQGLAINGEWGTVAVSWVVIWYQSNTLLWRPQHDLCERKSLMSMCFRWKSWWHCQSAVCYTDTLQEGGRRLLTMGVGHREGEMKPIGSQHSLVSSPPTGSAWDARCLWQSCRGVLLLDAGVEGCLGG